MLVGFANCYNKTIEEVTNDYERTSANLNNLKQYYENLGLKTLIKSIIFF